MKMHNIFEMHKNCKNQNTNKLISKPEVDILKNEPFNFFKSCSSVFFVLT